MVGFLGFFLIPWGMRSRFCLLVISQPRLSKRVRAGATQVPFIVNLIDHLTLLFLSFLIY